jgi:hypothetical protein
MTAFTRSATTPEVKVITAALFSQIMRVMGLKHPNWVTRSLYPIFLLPARRISRLIVELDREIPQKGFCPAVEKFLGNFVSHVELNGVENIPKQGPLMVICNHPAAYDVVILAAAIQREDLKILASDIQIVQMLPHIAEHVIPVPYHLPSRLQTVRASIRHLRDGGAIFLFPRGNVEPDPAISPGAEESLSNWSPSVELFLRSVPQTASVVAIASGVLSAKWFRNPLVNRWKKYEQRQKVAEILQLATQLLVGTKPGAIPKVSFSSPLMIDDLGGEAAGEGELLTSLTARARELLQKHPRVK